eukprot:TRINITY_DN1921_c0_g1_i3.p1 TRINITY_DN1921_c0_g1~~TRINITY_DN1921_c0_g1_i3.p1  ORF type:complete len:523 (-),score=100.54 TRINITY_DN1921_c0_g1_i3:106-1674(-)
MRALLLLLIALCVTCSSCASNLTIETTAGYIEGFQDQNFNIWLGVPYASPPVGSLRWQPPQPAQPWKDIRNTSQYSASCPQPDFKDYAQSEDCLYLNIWVPTHPSSLSPLPVYIFIHGGGFTQGAGLLYDGEFLAGKDIIVVTINYRLGALGFFAHPQLANTSDVNTTGFYGIQDQRAAIKWVKENIPAFGGDPDMITIGGESAGAFSTCYHLALPRSRGLFQRAILESGNCFIYNQKDGYANNEAVVARANCSRPDPADEIRCMMSLTPEQLYTANNISVYFPTMNEFEIMDLPLNLIRKGEVNKVSVLAGTNLNEGSAWITPYCNATSALFQFIIMTMYPDLYKQILPLYDLSDYTSPYDALDAVVSDNIFKCITSDLLSALANVTSDDPSFQYYLYSFEHPPSFEHNACLGVAHSFEIFFLFPLNYWYAFTPAERNMSLYMRDMWVNFITEGDPSTKDIHWPQFNTKEYPYLIINDVIIPGGVMFREPYCAFWHDHPHNPWSSNPDTFFNNDNDDDDMN